MFNTNLVEVRKVFEILTDVRNLNDFRDMKDFRGLKDFQIKSNRVSEIFRDLALFSRSE